MTKTVRIKVTAADIAAAYTGACPVARALERDYGGRWAVSRAPYKGHMVGVAELFPLGVSIRLSREVGRFVRDFDAHKPVQPFAFRVWR